MELRDTIALGSIVVGRTAYAGTAYHAGLPELQPQLSGGQMLRPRRPPVRSPAYQSFTVSRHVAMCGVLVWYSNAALLT
jgi:hypothetical protein